MLPLPPKPTFTPAKPHVYFVTAAQVYNALHDLGAENPLAIAALTNADMETAFHMSAVGDGGTAYNLWQWHWNPRGRRILAGTGTDVRSERSVKKVCEALWWEMTVWYPKAFAKMKAASTYEEATATFCTLIEGAGAADAAARRVQDSPYWGNWVARNSAFLAAHPAE